MFKYFFNILSGILAKAFGLLLIIVINKYYGSGQDVGIILYFWSLTIYFQSFIVIPLLYYSISIKKPIFQNFDKYFPFLILLPIIAYFLDVRSLPFAFWFIVLIINLRIDFNLLNNNKSIQYLYSFSLKNIPPILIFQFVTIEYLFYALLFGEILKTLIFKKYLSIKKQNEDINYQQLISYILFAGFIGSLTLIDKTFLVVQNPASIVDYELSYKFTEIFLTAITSGLVPLFISKFDNGKTEQTNILKITAILSTVIILLVFVGLDFGYNFISSNFNFNLNNDEVKILFQTSILLLLPLTLLSFLRKSTALILDKKIIIFYLAIILEKIIFLTILNYLNSANLIFIIYLNMFAVLLVETIFSFYIYRQNK